MQPAASLAAVVAGASASAPAPGRTALPSSAIGVGIPAGAGPASSHTLAGLLTLPAAQPRLLSDAQVQALRDALQGRLIALCFGAGVDSTAMVVALWAAGLRPDVITFADTGAEKQATLQHLARMQALLRGWGWPPIRVVRKRTLPTTAYSDLYGNCWANETLPSLAFGLKSCSIKYKVQAQDQFIKGAKRGPNAQPPHPVWIQALRRRSRITKLIGYDCGKADRRRAAAVARGDADFEYCYPLQLLGWTRSECVSAIALALGRHMVPEKSACTFCPASKPHELFWLAAHEPDQLESALRLEYRALTGRHSRFDAVEFGATWEDLVRNADRFPSTATCAGLGRSFSWCQWARVNDVAEQLAPGQWQVHRSAEACARFLAKAQSLRGDDNALDVRSLAGCDGVAHDAGISRHAQRGADQTARPRIIPIVDISAG